MQFSLKRTPFKTMTQTTFCVKERMSQATTSIQEHQSEAATSTCRL